MNLNRVLGWIAVHRKLIVFIVGAVLTAAIHTWGTDNTWVSLGILVATGAGVYGAPNQQPAPEATQPAPAPAPHP